MSDGFEFGSEALANELQLRYHNDSRCKVMIPGYSAMQRPIWLVRVGEGKRKLHLNAAVHGNEWITAWVLVDAIDGLLEEGNDKIRNQFTVDFIPMVNPDGVAFCLAGLSDWKANARGVDLNDQFPAGWWIEQARRGLTAPAAQDYGGEYPLSEPESQLLVALVREFQYESVLSVHAQGEEIYWNYRGFEPGVSQTWAEQLADVSGYKAVALSDSDAGFKDWFIQEFQKPGFTVEVGRGKNPLDSSCLPDICARFRKLFDQYLLLNSTT